MRPFRRLVAMSLGYLLVHPLACQEPAMPAKASPDLARAALRGNDHVDDSFSLAMLAAARALGVEAAADYDAVYCASANAFAPMVNAGEDCTSHWACEARLGDRAMDHVARLLGLRAVRLDLPEVDHAWTPERQREAWRGIAARVRKAMDGGAVVLTTGGWDTGLKEVDGKWRLVGPHGFVFWGAAGLVTDADPETGAIRGLHPNGHRDNPIVWRTTMWALTVAREPAEPLARDTLRLAVERIRGTGRFRAEEKTVYGTDAMRIWADHMATVPGFCAGCWANGTGKSWTDALDNGLRLHRAAGIAARYLRGVQGLPPAASPELAAAAACYDRIAAALAPSVEKDSARRYRNWIGDMDQQRAHAAILRQADADLRQAANHIEQALRLAGTAE